MAAKSWAGEPVWPVPCARLKKGVLAPARLPPRVAGVFERLRLHNSPICNLYLFSLPGRFMAFDRHMNLVLGDAEEFRKLPPKKGVSEEDVSRRGPCTSKHIAVA